MQYLASLQMVVFCDLDIFEMVVILHHWITLQSLWFLSFGAMLILKKKILHCC